MGSERFGRTLGIGVRVASNILRDRIGRAAPPSVQSAPQASSPNPEPARPTARWAADRAAVLAPSLANTGKMTRSAGRGAKRFGQAVWGPLVHAGSLLWLEVTGLFFALFALFFAQNAYRVRAAWERGSEHGHFLLYLALTVFFVWFSASSFLRAYRKGRKVRQKQEV